MRALGLDNVELINGDIAHVDLTSLGQFDFIICHGVYSWVPECVQAAILTACRTLLAATGVAYVSYNAYPGWKAKEIVRDAMLLSVDDTASPPEKVGHARREVEFLQRVAEPESVLARALADHQAMAAETGDYYLLHEELEAFNAPCYFRDFVDRARAHGMEYLAEAQPENMFVRNYGPVRGRSSAQGPRRRSRPRRTTSGPRGQSELPADTAGAFRTRAADFAHHESRSQPSSARRGVLAARRRPDSIR